ncbi:DUF6095 family protein [Costertonia aggregata]
MHFKGLKLMGYTFFLMFMAPVVL